MLQQIKRGSFPFIIALSALSVSCSAAFYSVYGLSKLFAGAQFEVIIMAGSLEVAKLVIASLLYQYWNTINKILRTYLTVATIILVLITSMGIYGFLSAAYQDTYTQLKISENKIAFLDQKREFYEKDVIRYDKELERISNNISNLSNAKSQQIQVRDTSVAGGVRTTISTAELRLAQSRINVEEENRKSIQAKREIVADSLQTYQLKILELQNNTEVAGELGPLKYISGLTGTPMDKIINILLLIIIFVFDPLAISLVVAANFAFDQAYPKRRKNLYGELEEVKKKVKKPIIEDDKRMDVIGQNGNDGLHYEPEHDGYMLDNDDVWQSKETPEPVKPPNPVSKTGLQLEGNILKVIQKGPSKWRVLLKSGEIVKVDKNKVKLAINNKPDDSSNSKVY
tara:strand:+ start:2830 stop:4023 length:1194 start_codon:yes stop_codon:yes gene_type:complete